MSEWLDPLRACRVRCTEHRGAVNHHWDTGVGEHFNLPGHDLANFNFLPFEKVRSSDPFVVETREKRVFVAMPFWRMKCREGEKRFPSTSLSSMG